jgi:hypothetical protein
MAKTRSTLPLSASWIAALPRASLSSKLTTVSSALISRAAKVRRISVIAVS